MPEPERMKSQKRIRTVADLAVRGALPAYAAPVHVGRPNIPDREGFFEHAEGIFDRAWLTNNGPLVQELETQLAHHLGVAHCVAMCNGTVALEIAIRALKLRGEVIVPSFTFIATAHALYWQEITPVFADIDAVTHNLDPDAVREMITPRTTGIIGVHLWGRPAPHTELQEVANEHGLTLLYDAAHAFDCTRSGKLIGSLGACEVFSFHATKCFNTFEGGAITTDDAELAEKLRWMRNFGFAGYDDVAHPGTNGKMIEMCAAMGLTNLKHMPAIIEANRANYAAYQAALAGIPGLTLRGHDPAERHNYQYVVLEIDANGELQRDAVIEALWAENILARKYFWPGCHRMRPYRDLFPHAGLMLRNTEDVARSVVVLPSGSTLPADVPSIVADVIRVLSHARE